jgi:formylglycine-generating enzyme required for sulfatase activity
MSERTIFLNALDKEDRTEQSKYLDEACAGDRALRERVEALLRSHREAGNFLSRPAVEPSAPVGSAVGETQAEPAAADRADLRFLAPSEKPGLLGRLGHYDVQEVVGQGAFGLVLKAFDEKLHRVVAIKVLAPAYAVNGTARKRFIREARAAAAVKNEHVVAIYNVQDDEQPPYLVMELIDGTSLQDKLDKQGPLGLPEVLRIGLQAAEGLAAAHKQGLVHRDIKPANILLENGVERVKITDFGLARAVDDASVTQSGTVAGTPLYMSPEQADGLAVDRRSDLFSLGTVLYAMCTGHPPFRASGTHAVLKRVIDASPRPIREINPEIPEWLCDIVAKLHAKKPEDRFESSGEVAALLEQGLAHVQQPDVVAPPTLGGMPKPRSKAWGCSLAYWGTLLAFLLAVFHATGLLDLSGAWAWLLYHELTLESEIGGSTVQIWLTEDKEESPDGSFSCRGNKPTINAVLTSTARKFRLAPGNYWVCMQKNDTGTPVDVGTDRGNRNYWGWAQSNGPRKLITVGWGGQSALRHSPNTAPPPAAVAPFDAARAKEHQDAWARHLSVSVEITNALRMKLRLIPPGTFLMGETQEVVDDLVRQIRERPAGQVNEQQVRDIRTEAPQHREEVPAPYYMGQHEVTVGQFRKFVEAAGYRTTAETKGDAGWRHADVSRSEDHPVAGISLQDATDFCAWLSKKDGRAHVLPDEKHWEFACRAGTTAPWYADKRQDLERFAWWAWNAEGTTHPVGGKLPNAFGLYDMLGNVEELCRTLGGGVVGRGGMFHLGPYGIRCAARRQFAEDATHDRRGFRVAIVGDLKAKAKAPE